MPFVPIAESGLTFDVFEGSGGAVGVDGSQVTALNSSGWYLWFTGVDTPQQRIRVTILSFEDDIGEGYDGTSAFTNSQVGGSVAVEETFENQSPNVNDEFLPSPFEMNCPRSIDNAYGPTVRFYGIPGGSEQMPRYNMVVLIEVDVPDSEYTNPYNCDCDCGYPTKTLAELRSEVATLMGYSSQLAALPPGFSELVRRHLNMMQKMIVADISEIRNDRYFSWDVAIGQTKFCTTENLETCRRLLVATKVREMFFIQAGNIITKLRKGIPFLLHSGGEPSSIPSLYEIRSCIEIWPPPSVTGTLYAKGTLAAVDMVEDGDACSVDEAALVLRTVAFMKANKGHQDANIYMSQYQDYIGSLMSDSHNDMRYIPRGCDDPCFSDDDCLTPRIHPPIFMGD